MLQDIVEGAGARLVLSTLHRLRQRYTPLLYDSFYAGHIGSFTSNTVDFLPGWSGVYKRWGFQQMVTARQDQHGTNHLYFVPIVLMKGVPKKKHYPAMKLTPSFELPPALGQITRVRHMPQDPTMLAVKGSSSGVLLITAPQAEAAVLEEEEEMEIDGTEIVGRLGFGELPQPQHNGLAWSPPGADGALLYTAEKGQIVLHRVHPAATEVFSGSHTNGVNDVTWVPSGGPGTPHTFSSVGEDGKLCCWDLRAGTVPVCNCYVVGQGAATALAYSTHAPYTLVTGGVDARLAVLDMRCTAPSSHWAPKCHLHTILCSHNYPINQVSFSPHQDGLFAACDLSGQVMLWDLNATIGNGIVKPAQRRFIHRRHLSTVLDLSWSLCDGPPVLATVSKAFKDDGRLLEGSHVWQVWSPHSDFL